MAAAVSNSDSGELKRFPQTERAGGSSTNGLWKWLAAHLLALVTALIVGARWTAQMEAAAQTQAIQTESLKMMVQQVITDQDRRINSVADDIELVDLKVQNLSRELAVVQDRLGRGER